MNAINVVFSPPCVVESLVMTAYTFDACLNFAPVATFDAGGGWVTCAQVMESCVRAIMNDRSKEPDLVVVQHLTVLCR